MKMHDFNTHSCCNDNNADGCVVQDGVCCPKTSPWGYGTAVLTGIPLTLMTIVAVYILAKTSVTALVVWLLLLVIFAVPLRYLICARCPYYGQACSTFIGPVIPMIMKKQEGKSMVFGLWMDVVFFLLLFTIPLPFAWNGLGWPMTLLWVNSVALVALALTRFGCVKCPFTFCPIGKAGRAFWIVK